MPPEASYRFVFIHDRKDWLLAAILLILGKRGFHCTVIGCNAYEGIGGCDQAYSLEDLSPILAKYKPFQAFREHYHTPTVNDRSYERFCFERWFYLYAYAAQCGESLVYLDSDYLVSEDFDPARLPFGFDRFYDTPFINTISGTDGIQAFLDYLARVQFDSGLADHLSSKYAVSGEPHLSDMHCLIEFGATHPDVCVPLTSNLFSLGLCPNISNGGPFQMQGPIRNIFVDATRSRFLCRHKVSGLITPFYSLHFQGVSKAVAPLFMEPMILRSMPWNDQTLFELYINSIVHRRAYWVTSQGRNILYLLQILESPDPISAESEATIVRRLLSAPL